MQQKHVFSSRVKSYQEAWPTVTTALAAITANQSQHRPQVVLTDYILSSMFFFLIKNLKGRLIPTDSNSTSVHLEQEWKIN